MPISVILFPHIGHLTCLGIDVPWSFADNYHRKMIAKIYGFLERAFTYLLIASTGLLDLGASCTLVLELVL